jgi:hypothetical protein
MSDSVLLSFKIFAQKKNATALNVKCNVGRATTPLLAGEHKNAIWQK